jgi:pyruvate dehydrogenase E2 component (dihydrolipoamide acetyltransferase)
MATEVILPKVDMDMSTGTISKWHVKDGEAVKKGQAVFEIETDKAAMEIESPAEGVIKISGAAGEGTSLAIGTVVAMIYAAGEEAKAFAGSASAPARPAPSSAVIPAKAGTQADASLGPRVRGDDEIEGKIRATPLAKRLAKQNGISIASIKGSGPRGRIVAADIQKAPAAKPSVAAPTAALASGMDTTSVKALYAEGSFDVKPLDGMRRTIAQRLTQSKQTIPHFYLSATCTIDQLLSTRERLNSNAPRNADKSPVWKLSINDFIIKAFALALQKVPAGNVTYTDEGILQHRASDIGVAVSVEGGLFTPIVRSAETKPLSAISAEMKELAAKARSRKLQSHEYQGGTAAISNLGMFGVEQFTAIINPPHASILAVGSAVERFIPVDRQPVLATQMTVTLSVDHRAVDGAVGAELLAAFKSLIEDPAMMLV